MKNYFRTFWSFIEAALYLRQPSSKMKLSHCLRSHAKCGVNSLYDHPICQCGVQLVDMVYLQREL